MFHESVPLARCIHELFPQVSVECSKELGALEKNLNTMYSTSQVSLVGVPLVGMWACAIFKQDGNLYRVKISSKFCRSVFERIVACCHMTQV